MTERNTAESGRTRRIDLHAHFIPEVYRRAAVEAGFGKPDGMPGIPPWSLDDALAMMDRNSIDFAVLSISAPGIYFGDLPRTIELARHVNDYAADIVARYPDRFGFFAMLPLPDVEAALAELTRAFDDLDADGIVMTSNQSGIYPGDPRYDPLLAELNRRHARLFVHPTSPCGSCPGGTEFPYPRPILEFMFETTRVVTNLILTGTTRRYPDVNLIIPHAGAALPVLADRIAGVLAMLPSAAKVEPTQVFEELRRIYYDVAGFALPRLLPTLLQIADPAHLLYGSDWPHTPQAFVARLIADLEGANILDASQMQSLWHGNAERLIPRSAARAGG